MRHLIIGSSAAAIGCVEGIRMADREAEILMISKEPSYSRPLISYLLEKKTTEEKLWLRPEAFFTENRVERRFGETVSELHPEKKTVTLESGEEVAYDRLLLATGSTPLVLSVPGLETVSSAHTFLSLDDAKGLEKALCKESRVLILGAGLIGLKCAEGIRKLCREITIVDLAPRILPNVLLEEPAQIVKEHIEKQGVGFRLAQSIERFRGNRALLKSGETIDFDVFVMAVGVRPNVSLFAPHGEVARGIVTDSRGETGVLGIFAAGDCAESFDMTTGTRRVLALLPNAELQGRVAGQNMAGKEIRFETAMPVNATSFFGLHLATAGSYDAKAYSAGEGETRVLFCRENRLVGFILLGDVSRAGIYTALIRNKTPLDEIDFALIRQKPQLMAFARQDRARMMQGLPF